MKKDPLFTKAFALCAFANALQAVAFNLFLHLPGFLEELGASPLLIGWMFSLPALVAILARPAIGTRMDRSGRRSLILAGNVLNVVVVSLYLGVDSIGPALYAIRIVHGFSEAVLFTVFFTYAADIVPSSRLTEGLAIFGVSGMLPMSLAGVLGDWLLARADYTALFATALGFSMAALLFSLPLREIERPPGAGPAEPRGFLAAVVDPRLRPIWWISTVFFVALAAIFVFLKTFVIARGVGSVGGFFSAYTAVAIFLRVALGWLPDRVGPKRVLVPSIVALALGFAALARAQSDFDVMLAGMLCGLGHGYTFPILFGLVVRRTRMDDRGSAIAIYTGMADVGMVVGGPAFGWMLERWNYGVLYAVGAGVLLAGIVIFLFLDRGHDAPVDLASLEYRSGGDP